MPYKYNFPMSQTISNVDPILGEDGVYHYLYKIVNNINKKFYYGVHSTDNISDGYPGSGVILHKAYKKYGVNNFTKEILKYFSTEQQLFDAEFEIITPELILSEQCYNMASGGGKSLLNHTIVRDTNGNILKVNIDDDRLKSGELVGVTKNTVTVRDANGNAMRIPSYIYRNNQDKYISCSKGKIIVHDKDMNTMMVDVDNPGLTDGTYTFLLKTVNKDTTLAKDENGKLYRVNKNDERLKTGEFVGVTKNTIKVFKENTIKCIGVDELETYLSDGWERGNLIKHKYKMLKNGKTKFINPDELETYLSDGWVRSTYTKGKYKILKNGKTKFINPDELETYLSDGWVRSDASKGRVCVHKGGLQKRINPDELETYLSDGWVKGHGQKNCFGKISIHKNDQRKFINPDELEIYLSNGWERGLKHK